MYNVYFIFHLKQSVRNVAWKQHTLENFVKLTTKTMTSVAVADLAQTLIFFEDKEFVFNR